MKEKIGEFAKNISVASGELYLGYLAMGIFPLGTLAGILLIERGVRNFQRNFGL